ncbi:hypothetical protein DP939_37955 [Spongiactinospora rosea]|uniref:Uncharacterized protein n=1 Tax=Spongiactinospora rosea TaxID=2248750 RepID=A0A366LNV8_9ACTN|nr:hypothetical protein [Spongiactinospora rosea]RBQ14974.1 hypothetical protein DP939_37955 [Spongiactinospora rosea]
MFGKRTAAGVWRCRTDGRWEPAARQRSLAFGKVIATGEHDAWAFGWKIVGISAWIPMADGPQRPTAFRWDGDRWRSGALPVEHGTIGPVAASGPADVWAVGDTGILRWDGRSWAVVHRSPGMVGDLAVLAADDVWVFGDHRAWHYDGATWSRRPLPFRAAQVSARSATDIWALDDDALRLHHFDGEDWHRIDPTPALPEIPPSTYPPGPQLTAITADPTGVWITGEIGMSSFLLVPAGSGWRYEDTSTTAGRMIRDIPPVPDGEGGHWLVGSTDINGHDSALAHRDPSGHWTTIPAGGELTSLSATPGGTLLAAGRISVIG